MPQEVETYYISFYPDEEAQGGALREIYLTKGRDFDLVLKRARIRGLQLRAKSFVIFKMAMPRVWLV